MGLFTSKEKWAIRVPDISCGHCETRVQNALEHLDGIVSVRADSKKKLVTLQVDRSAPPERSVVDSVLSGAGYPPATE